MESNQCQTHNSFIENICLKNLNTESDSKQNELGHHLEKKQTLPPRDESFPRKVSLISSPIHYRTLQQSQRYNDQSLSLISVCCNHLNLLLMISCFCSYLNINFTIMFITFQMIQYSFKFFYQHIQFSIFRLIKESLLSVFCYIMMQAFIMIMI